MTPARAAADRRPERGGADLDPGPRPARLFAPASLGLSPRMLLRPRAKRGVLPFPFSDSRARYFHLGRNGIYALAQHWKLEGREVLFPAYFHGVELEALLHAGVRPRFYRVRPRMRVETSDIVSRIGPDTRAIYLIHYLGFPGPAAELAQVARERGLLLIEDCALSLLSRAGDRPLGSWGDAAIFCLYKTLPVPNGGVVVLRTGEPLALAPGQPPSLASTVAQVGRCLDRNLRVHGPRWPRGTLNAVRAAGRTVARVVGTTGVEVGTNHFALSQAGWAMSRVSHRIVSGQDFPAIVERRRQNYRYLRDRLHDIAPPVFADLPAGVCPHSYPLQAPNKPALVAQFLARGVEAVNLWFPNHARGPREPYPEAEDLRRTVLELPCHQDLTPQAIGRVAEVARAILGR
jgi:perosamine synthetase